MKRSITEIEHSSQEQTLGRTPIQGQTLGQRSGRSASKADTGPPASKRQDRSSSSGLREVPTDSMGTAAAVGTDPTAPGTGTDPATLGSVMDPPTATTGTDPATSAIGTDPMALARVTDTPANEDSIAPQAASGIVSDRATAGHSASTGAGPDSHDREEIPTEDAAMGRAAAGHSASTGAGPDSHDQPRHSNSVESRTPSEAFDGSSHSRRRPKYDDRSRSSTSTDPSGALGSWIESWCANSCYHW